MVCMDEIMPRLYLGGITGIFDPAVLQSMGITHVLSLMDRALPGELMSGFAYRHVFALDLYDHNLLQDLEECLKFVDEGRQHGGVLVHCQAGASRSAAVVTAYIMRTCSMTRAAALEFVKLRRSIVGPNEGFLQQLDLFEIMGCKINESHEEFRRYMLNKIAIRSKSGESHEEFCRYMLNKMAVRSKSSFNKDKVPSSIYRPETSPMTADDTVYKCRKCRRALFLSSALMPHIKGQGESAFDWRSKVPASQRPQQMTPDPSKGDLREDEEGEKCDLSLFIEPMMWMKGQVEAVEGKLPCPKCNAKLGSFVWYGERCPCGAWVAPAFHIQNSKVDAMKPRFVPPPGLQAASPSLTAQSSTDQQTAVSAQAIPSTAAVSAD